LSIDYLLLPALLLRQGHIVSHLDHEGCDALAELLRQLLASRCRVFDGVVQPAGGHQFGIRPFGRYRKQVRDLGEVIDIRLTAAPLPLLAGVPPRREIGSFGDKT
jgi:hypothetical protein